MANVPGRSCVAPGGERSRDWLEPTVSGQSNPRPPVTVVAVESGDDAAERRSCGRSETMMVMPILARVGKGVVLSREVKKPTSLSFDN